MNATYGLPLAVATALLVPAPTFAEAPATDSVPGNARLSTLLELPPGQQRTLRSASTLLDPNQIDLQTAGDIRESQGTSHPGYGSTLGFNTTATPTVARYAALETADLKATLDSTDNPAVRALVGEVLKLKEAGLPADQIAGKLADRSGFLSDGGLPRTLGFDPGWILTDRARSTALRLPDPAALALQSTAARPALDPAKRMQLTALGELDFFLLAGRPSRSATQPASAANADAIQHVVSFAYSLGDSPLLLLGFEDLYHGQNDAAADLFSVDLGADNVAALTATPEPATWLTLGACTAVGLWWRRKNTHPTNPEMVGG